MAPTGLLGGSVKSNKACGLEALPCLSHLPVVSNGQLAIECALYRMRTILCRNNE